MDEKFLFTWEYFVNQIKSIGLGDIVDILLVAVLFYFVYAFIRDRRAGKLAAGVALLMLLMLVSSLFGFSAMSFIMSNLFQVGFVALVVVFQPELRSALERMGGEPLKSLRTIGESKEPQTAISPYIEELCQAVDKLSRDKTGALVVIEGSTKLGDIIKTGVMVNADISSFVLRNIFYNGAPLHDGAVVVRAWRVLAAGCFLPLSTNEDIIKDLGTRHRAGIGMSEESDAVVIIVSEETGNVSLAIDGQLKRGYTYHSLKRELERLYLNAPSSNLGNVTRRMAHRKKEDMQKEKEKVGKGGHDR